MLHVQEQRVRPTLKRTKFACVNCKAAKAACDTNRPCAWCVRHALHDSCVDAPRKVRTSKKICCDPSLHAKTVVYKQENKGDFQLALAADFTPTTLIPIGPPLSPPTDIFPIEDLLAPSFDFGLTTSNNQPCTGCPLFQTCAKDATQRLICATSASPPQSPLSPEHDDDDDVADTYAMLPIALANHPDFSLQMPSAKTKLDSVALSPPNLSTPQQQSPQTPQTPSPQQVITTPSTVVTVQPRNLQGCCSLSSSTLPPLIDDTCNCQNLVQREMAKINAALETISALMQLQNGPSIPTATFRTSDTTIEDCNDEFAKALGYEGRNELLSLLSGDVIVSEQQISDGESKLIKPQLTALVPERWVPGLLKCVNNLPKATLPFVNQLVFSSKRGENRYFTVLIKPCGWFSYITLLKQHAQMIENIVMCGE